MWRQCFKRLFRDLILIRKIKVLDNRKEDRTLELRPRGGSSETVNKVLFCFLKLQVEVNSSTGNRSPVA